MSEELENLQKEKLRTEIKELKRPLVQRSTFWLALTGALVAVIGVGAQSYLSKIERAQAELFTEKAGKQLAETVARRDSVQQIVDSLQDQAAELQVANANLKRQAHDLVTAVTSNEPTSKSEKIDAAVNSVKNAFYSISIYGYNIDQNKFDSAQHVLINEGYSVVKARLLPVRQPWLSDHSVVLYYDNSSEDTVQKLANDLERSTGQRFQIQKGAGFGIVKGEESKTIKIHVIG